MFFGACVRVDNECTGYFECPKGLKQGCLLSPIIFSVFVNELSKLIENSNLRGIQLFPDLTEIFLLLFADNIVLISDTIKGLQQKLEVLKNFCKDFKMIVNVIKTKVMVFRQGGMLRQREKWYYDGQLLETVNVFHYVGLLFSTKLSFGRMAEDLASKGKRALISVLQSLSEYGNLSKTAFF